MDYDKFKKELEEYDDWERINYNEGKNPTRPRVPGKLASKRWLTSLEGKHALNDAWLGIDGWTGQEDRVSSPSHYTSGKTEAIEIIEDAVAVAPTPQSGFLQGQVIKYLLRVWLKDNPVEDLKKAQWYLTRLIDKLEGEQ